MQATNQSTNLNETPVLRNNVNPKGWQSRQIPTREITSVSFDDVIDSLNPIAHIPVAAHLTDTPAPSPIASMIGGALIGGPIGFAIAAVNVVFQEATGDSLIGSLYDAVSNNLPSSDKAKRYQSLANEHKRDLQTWRNA